MARDGAADTAVAPTATKKVAQEAGPSKGKAVEKATTQAGSVAEGKNDPSAEWKKQMMEEMMQKVNQLGTYGDMTEQVIRGVTQSPFTEWISDEPKPKDFVVPTMQSFDGSSDPVDHLYQFQQKMAIETKSEALSCKAFSTTLSGLAMMWFRQLKPKSINDFTSLCQVFMKQYGSNRKYQKTMDDLYQMEQKEEENPRDYLYRFTGVMNQIHSVDSATAARIFYKSLYPGSLLQENLLQTIPRDMAEVQRRAEGVFRVLENREKNKKKIAAMAITTPAPPNQGSNRSQGRKRNCQEVIPAREPRKQTRRDDHSGFESREYIEFNTGIDVIYAQTKDKGIYRAPPRSSLPDSMKDKSKYCKFHQDYGHEIAECKNLKGQILAIMRKGGLDQYRKKAGGPSEATETPMGRPKGAAAVEFDGEDYEGERLIHVSTIFGGAEPTAAQDERARKENAMEQRAKRLKGLGHTVNMSSMDQYAPAAPIAFTEADLQGIRIPHEDPLVVSIRIGQCRMSRMLVDGGSGADIIFWDAFQKMQIPHNEIRPSTTPIMSFSGEKVYPKGAITLPVYAAERIVEVDFVLIDARTTLNGIMGRTWIHKMKGVVSTLHQVMRCQSPDGTYTIDVKGDQGQAKKCCNLGKLAEVSSTAAEPSDK